MVKRKGKAKVKQSRRRGKGKGKGRGRGKRRLSSRRFMRGRGSDIVDKIIDKLPVELHLPGHNFTGPGTKLHKRLDKHGRPLPHSKPKNKVDEVSMHHDICYNKNKSREGRKKCDLDMMSRLNNLKKLSIREKIERALIKPVMAKKVKLNI